MSKPERFEFAMSFIGDPDEAIIRAYVADLARDAERYRKLVATGKYCAASIGGGWGLTCGNGWRDTKEALDAAADALPADAAMPKEPK